MILPHLFHITPNYITPMLRKTTLSVKFSLLLASVAFLTGANITKAEKNPIVANKLITSDAFSLTDCSIFIDPSDFTIVGKTAQLLAKDIEAVTGNSPEIVNHLPKGSVIILGTLGKNKEINSLITENKLDISAIKGGWEQFIISRIRNPFPDIDQALVIVGSDRRGTAYGAFTLSEAMGVSAWKWWADVPVKKHDHLYVIKDFTSKVPSIKYRGIFINDEDWGLKPWSSKNYEKELGDIGPKTYARVCELILRLKGNMLAPAMHSCTGAFYSHPENKKVADQYGIIISTSHCEPLLFNNASKSEWDKTRDGEWNYAVNKETILKKLDNRVKEAARYENVYTVGMRGLHDEGMRGEMTAKEKVNILEQVIIDQRKILSKYIPKQKDEIPQIFVPYKETLDLYNLGLEVPDDVTLVWTDDNYGYIKRLSNPEEQKRSGGSGVYYHTSYLGAPHDYLWLCTTPPVLMYEELKKAHDTGANRYWLLNIGDIKPAEIAMQTFFDLAWDVDQFDYAKANKQQSQFLADIFGKQYQGDFQDILDTYYRLAWSRKPEYMGWEREWDAPNYKNILDTDYSFENYNDAQKRLADYQRIADMVDQIGDSLPQEYQAAFFEMLEYSVKGANQMNRKFLLAQLNHQLAKEKDFASANWAAKESEKAFKTIQTLTEEYNSLLNGKWNHMMSLAPGLCAKYQNMPKLIHTKDIPEKPVTLIPRKEKEKLNGCSVINLKDIQRISNPYGHTIQLLKGIGYDWTTLQLGEATETTNDPKNLRGTYVQYKFSGVKSDNVTVYVYTVPTFPIYTGKSNQFGISVDGQPAIVSENLPTEYSDAWKTQVLQNGTVTTATFPIQKNLKNHTLTLTCGDPGVLIQRIVIDWGGLKQTYVGPSSFLKN